ncbi:MAG: 2-oxoacid:acceptor oxidoreductase family protein [Desulfobacterales bacterium]|nr:MAG: 2-oxoacid:acceptor oxidoreductase family protein [Desulfobacterales bacterium]
MAEEEISNEERQPSSGHQLPEQGDWVTGLHPMDGLLRGERLPHIWCQGCGLGTALTTFLGALQWLEKHQGWDLDKVCVVSGIGCTGRVAGYIRLDSFHTTHGRAIPFATGLKLANPELKVVVFSGDGDIAGIGGNHFIHAARRNLDITVICVNNFNYGMTGGQVGPTTPHGARAVTTPYGNFEYPFNLPYLAAAGGASFMARWTVLHVRRLEWTLREALGHPGFSFVEIIAPCSTSYARWNPDGWGLDPQKLRRRGLEVMKHYQKVGKIAHGTHPKDAAVKVDGRGVISEIPEGIFIDEPKPDLQASVDQITSIAKERWRAAQNALDARPPLPGRSDFVPRTEVQLGGFGGQGIMSAGRIIGQAATIYDKLQACFTQSYGPEARGGAAGSQVVIASDPIHHPHLIEPTSAIIMSTEACRKYVRKLAAGGTLLIDDGLVTLAEDHRRDLKTYGVPATRMAEEFGNVRAANAVMLGLWTAMIKAVSRAAMRQSLADEVPPKTLGVNLKAFDFGYAKGLQLQGR